MFKKKGTLQNTSFKTIIISCSEIESNKMLKALIGLASSRPNHLKYRIKHETPIRRLIPPLGG